MDQLKQHMTHSGETMRLKEGISLQRRQLSAGTNHIGYCRSIHWICITESIYTIYREELHRRVVSTESNQKPRLVCPFLGTGVSQGTKIRAIGHVINSLTFPPIIRVTSFLILRGSLPMWQDLQEPMFLLLLSTGVGIQHHRHYLQQREFTYSDNNIIHQVTQLTFPGRAGL